MGASVLHGTVGILVLALTVASCGDGASGGMNTGGDDGGGGAGGSTRGPSGLPRPDFSDLEAEILAPLDAAADDDPGGAPARIRLHLTQINGYKAWTAFLDVAVDGGPGVTQTDTAASWGVGDLTYTLEYRGEVSEFLRERDWRIFKDGDDGTFTYSNELFIDAYYEPFADDVLIDAFGRWLEVYNPNQTAEAARKWRVAFMQEGILVLHRRDDFDMFLLKKPDGTFIFEYYVSGRLNLSSEWDASGNGTWTLFDESESPVDTGSF